MWITPKARGSFTPRSGVRVSTGPGTGWGCGDRYRPDPAVAVPGAGAREVRRRTDVERRSRKRLASCSVGLPYRCEGGLVTARKTPRSTAAARRPE
jgi:hypothetical protein